MDVESFLRSFRRFSARRGLPHTLISDNAKTYKSASKESIKIVLSERVQTYFADHGIHWEFIVEKAPWWGGMWERMIRSVKRCIKKAVGQASLKCDELHTILVEIEGVINARSITYVYDDSEGISYPLTPSQLIYGRNVSVAPNDKHFEITSTHQSLTRRARHHRKVLNNFTKQWKQEYLLNLREIANQGNSKKPNIEPGDIVLLKNDQTKRCFWKLGKVVELLLGRDRNVRAAKVKVPNCIV